MRLSKKAREAVVDLQQSKAAYGYVEPRVATVLTRNNLAKTVKLQNSEQPEMVAVRLTALGVSVPFPNQSEALGDE